MIQPTQNFKAQLIANEKHACENRLPIAFALISWSRVRHAEKALMGPAGPAPPSSWAPKREQDEFSSRLGEWGRLQATLRATRNRQAGHMGPKGRVLDQDALECAQGSIKQSYWQERGPSLPQVVYVCWKSKSTSFILTYCPACPPTPRPDIPIVGHWLFHANVLFKHYAKAWI